jgi:hypothetical protein
MLLGSKGTSLHWVTVKAHHSPRTVTPPAIARDQKCRPVRPLELAANQ